MTDSSDGAFVSPRAVRAKCVSRILVFRTLRVRRHPPGLASTTKRLHFPTTSVLQFLKQVPVALGKDQPKTLPCLDIPQRRALLSDH